MLEIQLALSYSKQHIEHRHQEYAHMCSCPIDVAALLVDEGNRVASPTQNVDEYNEHSQNVHRLHLLAKVNDQIEQVLLMEPMVTYRTQVPHSKSASQVKKPYNKSNQFRQVVELKSTFTKPLGSTEKARRNVEWTTARGMNTFPFRHWVMKGNTSAQIDRNSKKKTPERNAAEKEGASTRQAAERRGGEGAAITHWPCDSEPKGLLDI